MSEYSSTVVVPTMSPVRIASLLRTLDLEAANAELIVVDNREQAEADSDPIAESSRIRVLRPGRNLGYSAAVNLAAREAGGDSLVLLNDDCTVEEGFVERITSALDPPSGFTMAAGVMRQASDPGLIDSAGMELDSTLLVFDYLHGQPVSLLVEGAPDPVGPSGAAAAFDRKSFLQAGGFDEALFAYWEDVDLVLRLRQRGERCRLAAEALGTHQHSMTLGSGSREKNRLMGFGRGYVLRKWSVLTLRRWPSVVARDIPICLGQMVIDRNLTGVTGRFQGMRAGTERNPYPEDLPESASLVKNLSRRFRRRKKIGTAGS